MNYTRLLKSILTVGAVILGSFIVVTLLLNLSGMDILFSLLIFLLFCLLVWGEYTRRDFFEK